MTPGALGERKTDGHTREMLRWSASRWMDDQQAEDFDADAVPDFLVEV